MCIHEHNTQQMSEERIQNIDILLEHTRGKSKYVYPLR